MDILIDRVWDGRLGNQLYPIMVGLSYYETNKHIFDRIIFNYSEIYYKESFNDNVLKDFPKLRDKIIFDNTEYERKLSENNFIDYRNVELTTHSSFNHDLYINGYCQNAKKIREDLVRKYIYPTREYVEEINRLYGDVNKKISLQIRRGDYLHKNFNDKFYTLNETYIKNIIQKYYNENTEFICLSDDIEWCKNNLNFIKNITFTDKTPNTKFNPTLIDFFIQMLTAGNISSPSSFGMLPSTLNVNKNTIINTPYYKFDEWNNNVDLQITKDWMIKEDIMPFIK